MRLVSVRFLLVAVVGLLPWSDVCGQGRYTQLTDVPTLYIETENGRSITSKEQYTKCTIIIVDGDSIATYPDTEIRGRGNSTWWNSDKKAYRIKFATKQKLLGRHFANARSWTLLANHGDKTMIRNALTYDLGRFMGMEVANENSREEPYITSSVFRIMYNVKNPKDDALTMQKRIAIGQWIEGMERAVKGNDFTDPERGYRAYIDEQSLVNWYVGAEITGNIDALYSIYMWKDADEQKMHFGPLWDLDIGYDNSSERSMLREMEAYLGLWNRPFEQVLRRMWQDWWFANACADRLNELIANGLQQFLLDHIDSLSAAISQSQAQNYRVWPINQQVFSFEKHRYYNNYQAYINDLKDFVRVHIPYLQQAFEQRRTTGIHQMENGELKMENETIYDLSGRKVSSTRPYSNTPTILIRNHQKILKK